MRKKIRRVIQVGLGGMGVHWLKLVSECNRWEPAAYVDVDQKRLDAASAQYNVPTALCYTDLKKALNEVEADALIDVTPQKFRQSVCCAAMDKGLDVLCEKPLCDTVAAAKALVAYAKKKHRTLMVCQNYRFQAAVRTARKFIASGKLGELGYVSARFFKGPKFGGFREQMPFPLVLDMSIHHFDMLRCMLSGDVKAVQAVSINAPWNWNKGDATAMAQLEMENGVVVNYAGSWIATGAETSWNGDWRFEGSKGVLLWENEVLTFSNKPNEREPVDLVKWSLSHHAHVIEAFAKALDADEEPETSGRNNINSLATTHAVVQAMKTKKRVLVRDVISGAR